MRSRSSFLPYDHPAQVVHPRYNLGPNGGILTALNLFTTKFDQVLDLVEKRAETVECASVFFLLLQGSSLMHSFCIYPAM